MGTYMLRRQKNDRKDNDELKEATYCYREVESMEDSTDGKTSLNKYLINDRGSTLQFQTSQRYKFQA